MLLSEFLKTPEGRQYSKAEWARRCFVTRGHFSQLAVGKKLPSLALACFIEDLTRGKVDVRSWPCTWPGDKPEVNHDEHADP